jgi:hypothetical protein
VENSFNKSNAHQMGLARFHKKLTKGSQNLELDKNPLQAHILPPVPPPHEPTQAVSSHESNEYDDLGSSRGRVLFACLFSLLTSQTLILNVENILPTYCAEHHHSLSHLLIAFIIR